ncbi:hypothetical protein D3C79_956020 [compost metagenome]
MHQGQFGEGGLLFEVAQAQHLAEGFDVGNVDSAPGILLGIGLGVEVMALRIQGSRVGVGGGADPGDTGDARLGAT